MPTSTLFLSRDPFRDFDRAWARGVRQTLEPSWVVRPSHDGAFSPAAETSRDGDDAVIRLELPGVDVGDVDVEVLGRRLVVSGERRDERSESTADTDEQRADGTRRLREIRYGAFRRVFRLGRDVAVEQVTASYDAGVLTLRVAGAHAGATGQRIEITTAGSEN